jgi:hypothetical protein
MRNEEPFNKIEQQFVDAANGNNFPFSEDAWKRMETLLDKKDDHKKPFLWLVPVLCVLLGALGWMLFKANKTKTAPEKIAAVTSKANNKEDINKEENKLLIQADTNSLQNETALTTKSNSSNFNNNNKTEKANSSHSFKAPFAKSKTKINFSGKTASNDVTVDARKKTFASNKKVNMQISAPDASADEETVQSKQIETKNENTSEIFINSKTNNTTVDGTKKTALKTTTETISKKIAIDSLTKKTNTKETLAKQKATNKQPKNILGKFFVSGSFGAESNSTKLLDIKNNPTVPRYGASIGYAFNKKWSIQTGFYTSSKKYGGGKDDYNFKDSYNWVGIATDISVDANCLVYEIPLTIQYNFLQKRNRSLFVTAGASAFIMKKEDYKFDYTVFTYPYTFNQSFTGNKHTLATANFSLGLEQKFSKKLAVQIAPRIAVPLGGVGEGEVKLFSTGIDFVVKYSPFKK